MITERDFIENKKQILQNLKKAKKEDKVDTDIIPILDLLNSIDDFYTSSSCYGRIVLLEIPKIGDKKNAKWLGKWHNKIRSDDISSAFKKAKNGQLWILAQAPIIHIYAKTQKAADKLLKTAISCGFKNSGFKSIDKNIVVEVTSTERLDAPVGKDGQLFCNNEYMDLIVDIANEIINRSVMKLARLENFLRDNYESS